VAATAEETLARTVHDMQHQQVVRWGDPIGSHGADVVSVNTKTGGVTLWDAKHRTANVAIQGSSTFKKGSKARANAIKQAVTAIRNDKSLSPEIREKALENLAKRKLTTHTVAFSNAKNSVIGN
jgi:filamentous hemagglutinin